MMFETSKYVPKTEQHCCVFKDKLIVLWKKGKFNLYFSHKLTKVMRLLF